MPRTPKVIAKNDYRDFSPDKMQFKHMSPDEVATEYLRDPASLMVPVPVLIFRLIDQVEDYREQLDFLQAALPRDPRKAVAAQKKRSASKVVVEQPPSRLQKGVDARLEKRSVRYCPNDRETGQHRSNNGLPCKCGARLEWVSP